MPISEIDTSKEMVAGEGIYTENISPNLFTAPVFTVLSKLL